MTFSTLRRLLIYKLPFLALDGRYPSDTCRAGRPMNRQVLGLTGR